jgi:hypothetical protein
MIRPLKMKPEHRAVMHRLRNAGPSILTTLLAAMLGLLGHAQSPIQPSSSVQVAPVAQLISNTKANNELPDGPSSATTVQQPTACITGTVTDANGAQIADAQVVLENTSSKTQRTVTTDSDGNFSFTSVESGSFHLTVAYAGFTTWSSPDVAVKSGETNELPAISLQIAPAMTEVQVNFTKHDIAEEEMHLEEKQRVLGVFPNFYASYVWNAEPLSSGQKFNMAYRTAVDPVTIAIPLLIAGIEQSQNDFSGYGQGTQGYAKRFGASYADTVISNVIGGAILPSLLHQDPRYFYKGTGSKRSRIFYAISTAFICKGDNGHWQPNYSNVIGNLASAGVSNIYYPSTDRGAMLTINNWLVGTAEGSIGALFQEFVVKKMSRGLPPAALAEAGN